MQKCINSKTNGFFFKYRNRSCICNHNQLQAFVSYTPHFRQFLEKEFFKNHRKYCYYILSIWNI